MEKKPKNKGKRNIDLEMTDLEIAGLAIEEGKVKKTQI